MPTQLTKSQSPMGKSPNSLLVSNANRSGGRITTDNHQNKFANSPSSTNQKSRSQKSSESGNDEENASGRIIYDDPQVYNEF